MCCLKWSPTASEFEIAFEYYITFFISNITNIIGTVSFKTDVKQHLNNKGKSCYTVFSCLYDYLWKGGFVTLRSNF